MSLTNEYLCYMEIDITSVICDTAECSCDTKENNGSDSCSLNICAMRMVMNSYKLYPGEHESSDSFFRMCGRGISL